MVNQNSLMILVSAGPDGVWIKKDAGGLNRLVNDLKKNVRDVGRGVRENVAPVRWIGEGLFSGYGKQMEALRELDDTINHWTRNLDNALDQALDARKQGRYLDVFFWLNQINNRLTFAHEAAKEFVDVNQEKFDEFFGKSRHGLQRDYLSKDVEMVDPTQSFDETVAAIVKDEIIKNAGFFQDMGEKITTWKMERMYKKRLQEMKRALDGLIGRASNTVGNVDTMLGHMSKARSKGDIASYLDWLGKVSEVQKKFENDFKTVYESKGFKEMVDRMQARQNREKEQAAKQQAEAPRELAVQDLTEAFEEEAAAEQAAAQQAPQVTPTIPDLPRPESVVPSVGGHTRPGVQPSQDERNQERIKEITQQVLSEPPKPTPVLDPAAFVSTPQSTWGNPPPAAAKESIIEDVSSPESGEGSLPIEPAQVAPEPVATVEKPKKKRPSRAKTKTSDVDESMMKLAHARFYEEMQKASKTADPYLLAAMILKYSEQIDETDPEKSLELISIAEGILNA